MYVNPKRVYVNSAAFSHVNDADRRVMRYFLRVGDEYALRKFYRNHVEVIVRGIAPPSYEQFIIYLRNMDV